MMADVTDMEQLEAEIVSYTSIIRNKYCQIHGLSVSRPYIYIYIYIYIYMYIK